MVIPRFTKGQKGSHNGLRKQIHFEYEYRDGNAMGVHKEIGEWEYHLQQMVIGENPSQYLKKFI